MSFIDPRDNRTSPFNSAEFGNAWAVFRGEVFQTYDLTPFQREWSEWLAERDRQMLERGYDEGKSAEELAWMHCFDGHPVPEGEVCDECRTDNPYRKEQNDG